MWHHRRDNELHLISPAGFMFVETSLMRLPTYLREGLVDALVALVTVVVMLLAMYFFCPAFIRKYPHAGDQHTFTTVHESATR